MSKLQKALDAMWADHRCVARLSVVCERCDGTGQAGPQPCPLCRSGRVMPAELIERATQTLVRSYPSIGDLRHAQAALEVLWTIDSHLAGGADGR